MFEKYAQELMAAQTMRPRLLRQRRDELVVLCIRRPALCSAARMALRPEHFSLPDERPHQTIIRHLWKLLDQLDAYTPGEVPYAALYDAIAQEMVGLREAELAQPWVGETINDPTVPGWEDQPPGLLYRAYHSAMEQFDDRYAYETLRLFLEERAVVDAVAGLVAATAGARVPLDHTARITTILETATRIEAIGANPFLLPMPAGWVPTPLVRFPTGAGWIDDTLGGQVAGDVNGILGMFSGGKTTAMAQIAVGTAFFFLEEAKRTGKKPRLAILVSYEEREDTIRPRILACAAQVSKTKLEEMTSWDDLTRTGKLAPYEMAMYREEGEEDFLHLPGEYERLQAAVARINQSLRIVDMRAGGRGHGWVDELAGLLDRLQHEEDAEIGLVCIDYVNAMCRRHIAHLGKDPDRLLRHFAHATPLRVEEKIARRFRCPVWLAQQFSGEANKRAPTAKMMLADASEARSFGENLVFCIGFGVTDPATRCLQATFVKTRRGGLMGKTVLLQLEGDMGRINSADHRYIVEGSRIVDRKLKTMFDGELAAPAQSPFLIDGGHSLGWGP